MLNAKLGRSRHDCLHVFNPNLEILSQLFVPNWPNTIILGIPICVRAIKSVVA